jgi:hypothetical protein
VTDELPVEVLDAPLDLALVPRVRRKRKMSVDAGLTAPFLSQLPELAAVIGKKGIRKPLLLLQRDRRFSHRQLVGQTAQHKLIHHLQYADLLEHHAKKLNNPSHAQTIRGSIVITLARLTLTILQAQSIRSWLDLLNKRITHCLNKRKTAKPLRWL